MSKPAGIETSKFLALVLRHRPERIGLELDEAGWARVSDLIECARRAGMDLSADTLREVVERNEKRRFSISEDGQKIRAVQGHSLSVDLGLEPIAPPELLYHGTTIRFVASIRDQGLKSRGRQHVHLSPDEKTALEVGARHGKPVVLRIEAGKMDAHGYEFFFSENGVWLTSDVPPEYIEFPR